MVLMPLDVSAAACRILFVLSVVKLVSVISVSSLLCCFSHSSKSLAKLVILAATCRFVPSYNGGAACGILFSECFGSEITRFYSTVDV